MQLPTEQRLTARPSIEAVRLADPDAIMARHHRARPAQLPRAGVLGATHKSSLIDVCYATTAKFRIAPK